MSEIVQASQIVSILERQSCILDEVLTEQAKIRTAVMGKNWPVLQDCISHMKELADSFVVLESERVRISAGQSLAVIPEARPAVEAVRSKLVKSKIENKALGDYVAITRGFLQNVLDNVVPQRRNTLYSRKGTIVKPQPESVVLNKLF
jgi:hypothetical protein